LRNLLASEDKGESVVIHADRDSPLASTVFVLNKCRGPGFQSMDIVVKDEG